MDNYTFILPNEKAATYKVVTFIIAIMNVVAFVLLVMKSASTEINSFLIPMGISHPNWVLAGSHWQSA